MYKQFSFPMVIVSIFIFLWSLPALAQYGYSVDEGGYIVKVEGWWVTPTGMGFDVATIDEDWFPDPLARGGGDILGIEFDSKFSGKYTLGWNFKGNLGSLAFSYWDYNEESSVSFMGDAQSYIIGEILPHPYYAGQGFFVPDFLYDTGRTDGVEAVASMKTTFLDVDFSKNIFDSQGHSGAWKIGLRNFKYEHQLTATYMGYPFFSNWLSPPPIPQLIEELSVVDIVTESIEADGTGPKVGFSGQYSFTKNINLYGAFDVSFIPGKISSRYLSMNDLEDHPEVDAPTGEDDEWGPFTFLLNRQDKDENFVIYDFDAGFEIAFAQKLSFAFGYRLTKMENIIYRIRFSPDKDWWGQVGDPAVDLYASWDAAAISHHDVSFGGPYFSISYEF